MSSNKYPRGWDQKKVERALSHYEGQTEEEAGAEDEEDVRPSTTVMKVPHELVSRVRALIAKSQR